MAIKVLVSLPQEFLKDVDRIAQEEHRSRSELVREALRAYLEMHRLKQMRLGQVAERGAMYGQSAEAFTAWETASHEAPAKTERKTEEERGKRIKASLQALAEKGTFADIEDPVAWQRQMRKDRPLPGREE